MNEPGPGRRERKKLQTRDALEAAALRLFEEKGYDDTTVEEIAEAADVAVRTFFRYFQSKQHVLFGDVANDISGRLRNALAAQPAALNPVDAVGGALARLELEDEDDRRQVTSRIRLVEKVPELGGTYHMLFQELHDVIAEFTAVRTGDSPRALYPQLLGSAATGSIKAALCVLESDPGIPDISAVLAEGYAMLTVGLRGE